jgi:hypothetical protein
VAFQHGTIGLKRAERRGLAPDRAKTVSLARFWQCWTFEIVIRCPPRSHCADEATRRTE